MLRTVADATRFTATSPHAHSKTTSILRSAANTFSPPSSPLPTPRSPPKQHIPNPPPSRPPIPPHQETPQQKVARIRALRAAQKLNQLTFWDKTVLRGRIWADVAHKITIRFLMWATVLAAFVTVFSLTDMIIYNRRKRALYLASELAHYNRTLSSAIAAEQEGKALTEDETDVLNLEKLVLKAEADREVRKEKGWGIKERLFGGWDMGAEGEEGKEDGQEKKWGNAEVEGRESLVGLVQQDGVMGAAKDVAGSVGLQGAVMDVRDSVGGQGSVMKAIEEKRREGEKPMETVEAPAAGGPLDRMAEGVVEKAKSGWFGGR